MKKVLSLLLCFVMLVTSLGFTVFADTEQNSAEALSETAEITNKIPVASEPVGSTSFDSNLTFYGKSLLLEEDISINYYIEKSKLSSYVSFGMVFTYKGVSSYAEYYTEKTINNVEYVVFTFDGTSAKEMGETVKAKPYGIKSSRTYYGSEVSYSILDYAKDKLGINAGSDATSDSSLKTLLADMLNYGAAAQTYFSYNTDNLVNSCLTGSFANLATTTNPTLRKITKYTQSDNDKVVFYGASLVLENYTKIKFYVEASGYNGNANDLVLYSEFADVEGNAKVSENELSEATISGHTYYCAEVDGISPALYRAPVTVVVKDKNGENVSSEFTFSVGSYAYGKNSGKTASLVKAMMKFSDSAYNYFVGDKLVVVSPNGNDSNPGTFELPLATFLGAKNKLKNISSDNTAYVLFYDGIYDLKTEITFTASDRDNVVFKAYGKNDVTVSGGTPIKNWTEETVNGIKVWSASVSNAVTSLYSENKELTLARYPDVGFNKLTAVDSEDQWSYDISDVSQNSPWWAIATQAVRVNKSDINRMSTNLDDFVNAKIRVYYVWAPQTTNIGSIENFDNDEYKIRFAWNTGIVMKPGCAYTIYDCKAALSVSGEWYYDSENSKVYYVPYPDDNIKDFTLYSGKYISPLNIINTDNLTFENLQFAYSALDVNTHYDGTQTACYSPAAVNVTNSDGITFKKCKFVDIGEGGIIVKEGTDNFTVDSCLFQNIGANAINIGNLKQDGTQVGAQENYEGIPKNIVINNNKIYKYGMLNNAASGILVGWALGADVTHNEISHGYWTGVSVGWVWGFGTQLTDQISVEYNLIHDIGYGVMGDLGGVYTLGPLEESNISYNIIYNITRGTAQDAYGGWGLYNDEGSSGIMMDHNIVFGCDGEAYQLHFGRDLTLENNILISTCNYPIYTTRDSDYSGNYYHQLDFNRNLIIKNGSSFDYFKNVSTSTCSGNGNIFWDLQNGALSSEINILLLSVRSLP